MTNTATAVRRKTPFWAKILLFVFILLLLGAAGYTGLAFGKTLGATESRDVQVIRSITREEQIVLLTAGVGDLRQEEGDGIVLGVDLPGLDAFTFELPGSRRVMLVRYDFDAKLGIEGKDVAIESTGDGAYLITIPTFIFLGHDDPHISVASENGGVLSWVTPQIDKFKVAEAVLSDETLAETIDGARPVLEEQAETFYSNIIHAIDPSITLTFEFAQ